MSGDVFTVGHAATYDSGIVNYGVDFKKAGKSHDYAGGVALSTVDDALRFIEEQGKTGEWAVYQLDADWDRDTLLADDWWRSLLTDSMILRKVAG